MQQPSSAVIAITLNCNSKCLMCNIWKNKSTKESEPEIYKKLPKSLKDINISGGEPFLRSDLLEIIKVIKENNPQAKLIINTNGLLTSKIQSQIKNILKIDKNIGIRVSIDGWKQTHDTIRGIKNAFSKSVKTIKILQQNNIKDLGISFTILDHNYKELPKIYNYCQKNKIQLSLTLVSSSPIYFGNDKQNLQPKNKEEFKKYIQYIYRKNYLSLNIKNNFRAWFEEELYNYYISKKRRFSCNAGSDFFYMDAFGNIFTCHLKNNLLGNLSKNSFQNIWEKSKKYQDKISNCHDCWMVCNVKTEIKKNILPISKEIIIKKFKCLKK